MAIVRTVVYNDLDEATAVTVLKGSSREIVTRHTSSIIPLLRNKSVKCSQNVEPEEKSPTVRRKSKRRAAEICRQKLAQETNQ